MQIHDIAIIGAGPAGLSLASRLLEPFPSALYTDTEHARFFNRPSDKNTIERRLTQPRTQTRHQSNDPPIPSSNPRVGYSMLVLDATSDKWLAGWRDKFQKLEIEELRSPLFFHPDPRDRDGLLAFAYENQRQGELSEIEGVVGREGSKHSRKKLARRRGSRRGQRVGGHLDLDNRDRNDYFTVTTGLFEDYIDEVVGRYGLDRGVRRAEVVDVQYGSVAGSGGGEKVFTLMSSDGEVHRARVVVIATGPPASEIPSSIRVMGGWDKDGSASHIFWSGQLIPTLLAERLQTGSTEPVNVVIVGGGLSSAQTAILLLDTYSSRPHFRVHLVLRSKLNVKHFDVDLPWVAKLRNRRMAEFWSVDSDAERFDMLKEARGGGSVTSKYAKLMKSEEAKGRLVIHREQEIDFRNEAGVDRSTSWNDDMKTWRVVSKSSGHHPLRASHKHCRDAEIQPRVIEGVAHIFFATSSSPEITTLPFLHNIRKAFPVEDVNGLPILTEDLRLCSSVPLFVTGALAGLRLGPGAGNLAGARQGAERIAWAIEDMFGGASAEAERHIADGYCGTMSEVSRDSGQTSEVRRDSGYTSENQSPIKEAAHQEAFMIPASDARRRRETLGELYIEGVGNRFEALARLGH